MPPARWLSLHTGEELADGGGKVHATLSADSFFGACIPAGQVLCLDIPAGLGLQVVNVATEQGRARQGCASSAALHVGLGAAPLAPVASVQQQTSVGAALVGPCRLAALGDTLVVTGRLALLRGSLRAARALDADLAEWTALCEKRRELGAAQTASGLSWAAQAEAEGLPLDKAALRLHEQCAALIAAHLLRRGVPLWQPEAGSYKLPAGWDALGMPAALEAAADGGFKRRDRAALRALVTDALSPALSAAHALRLARVAPTRGALSLLVLGAEGGELRGRAKWAELLKTVRGARRVHVWFVGPEVPARLHGTSCTLRGSGGGRVRLSFVRGLYHEAAPALPAAARAPHLALGLNSGLADFFDSWGPTLAALLAARVPLALTSYHAQEAELDARTLAARLGARILVGAAPNPFASELPHLDETFPGRAYASNSFITVCRGYEGSPK